MNRKSILCILAASWLFVNLAGCGGDSSSDSSMATGSCDLTVSIDYFGTCEEYEGTATILRNAKEICWSFKKGIWSDAKCSRNKVLGGCRLTTTYTTMTWYYPGAFLDNRIVSTTSDVQMHCPVGSSFVAP